MLKKIKKRLWEILVRKFRNHFFYPLLYLSWWHSHLPLPKKYKQQIAYLTAIPNRGAGIGHQMANWIAGLWFARKFQLKFAHIPFSSESWEQFLGFGEGEVNVDILVRSYGYKEVLLPLFDEFSPIEVERTLRIINSYQGRKVIFILEQDQFYRDQYGVMDIIQDKFFKASARNNDQIKYLPECFNIAIHIRRGDIVVDQEDGNSNLLMRWQDTNYFREVLVDVLKNVRTDKTVKVYLFSQGSREEFVEFENLENVEFCLEMGAQESFLHMVYADLLITSKSSFSYKPALLSRGIKVCPRNFWHGYPDSKDWILVESNGLFDKSRLNI